MDPQNQPNTPPTPGPAPGGPVPMPGPNPPAGPVGPAPGPMKPMKDSNAMKWVWYVLGLVVIVVILWFIFKK